MSTEPTDGIVARMIGGVIAQKLVLLTLLALALGFGLLSAPFDWDLGVPRDPIAVDALPDIGENQQIVFTDVPGRSPQDVDDQVTYPLTVEMMGIPHVRTLRGFSAFGFSTIYVIFDEEIEFDLSRSLINERIASLPPDTLPEGLSPQLGPSATALGQVLWYTLEGRDPEGNPTGGWDLQELRTIQDYQVRFALAAADGVAEVASVGGYTLEYQVDVDPDAMRAFGVTLPQVVAAVRAANAEVGARTTEINRVEYVVRGDGFVDSLDDLRDAVVTIVDSVPVRVGDVAVVGHGPAQRRGALDRGGAEVVGGVVVARYGANPMQVMRNVREALEPLGAALPSRVLEDGTISQVTLVPFYDRSELIAATVGTLETALIQQLMITALVVLVLLLHIRAAVIVSMLVPLAVILTFAFMKLAGVDANVVALAGIAIAIGTMVDIGIVITENIVERLQLGNGESRVDSVRRATGEVGVAVITATATTMLSFIPVFFLDGSEGRLFRPLAATKTFALGSALIIAFIVIPPLAIALLRGKTDEVTAANRPRVQSGLATFLRHSGVDIAIGLALIAFGALVWARVHPIVGTVIATLGVARIAESTGWLGRHQKLGKGLAQLTALTLALAVCWTLSLAWLPLGAGAGDLSNFAFVGGISASLLITFFFFERAYPHLLRWALDHKAVSLVIPAGVLATGLMAWMGFAGVFGWLPQSVHTSRVGVTMHHAFPGLGTEFMPQLDEGDFLYMPSTMAHASIGETLELMQQLDMLIETVPEVEYAVGKLGRADSSLDPAPVSMIETIIGYQDEYRVDADGRRLRYEVDANGEFVRDDSGDLILDPQGMPYRNWRPEIETQQDIWDEIVAAAQVPGLTSAPLLQPISARVVMLQSGIRAPMAVRLEGPNLAALATTSLAIESVLRGIPTVISDSVNADRPVGKPYIELHPDREALLRYGVSMQAVQQLIAVAIGGQQIGQTVEGRERYPIRVRYPRELRDTPTRIAEILVPVSTGAQVPLAELVDIRYVRGPQMIRSEDANLVSYVMFGGVAGMGEVDVVESVRLVLESQVADGDLELAPGVSYTFAGSYENAIHAQQRMAVMIPVVMLCIFLLLYLGFRSVLTTLIVFTGVAVALGGGFVLLWLYAQPGFLDVNLFGANLADTFHVGPIHLSVAVWVGFIALFGIATDDGVVMATYLDQQFKNAPPAGSIDAIRERVRIAGSRRIRACLMTTATTILALLPILTSYGTGADVMIPMAIPALGGMTFELITLFVVPVLYCAREEARFYITPAPERDAQSTPS